MKKFIIAMAALLLLCGCEKGTEIPAEISETAVQNVTASEVTTTLKTAVTTVETTTVTAEETIPLTPLEEAQAWADEKSYRFLYDITGDGFPEMFDMPIGEFVDFEGYITSLTYDINWAISTGETIYVCRDTDGRIFLASCYGEYGMAGCTHFYAMRYDFYSNCVIETTLGRAEIYSGNYGNNLYYRGICKFLGEQLDDDVGIENKLTEYVSGYELIDTIVLKHDRKNEDDSVSFGANTDFAEEASDGLPEYQSGEVFIGGFEYDKDFPTVWLDDRYFENSFNYDELNKLKNLNYVSFEQLSEENIEKAAIKGGDWCGKIEKIYIDASEWGTVRGFSELYNVEHVIISGNGIKRADLEFLKDMPSVRYIYAYFTADSAEAFIPLSEMPNLEAIIDSGHGSCMENLSNDEREKVMELLPKDKYFWGSVK